MVSYRRHLIPAALVVVAAGLRILGIGWGLPQVYEEATPLRHAWEMWGWGLDRGFDPNPHFFNYPSLTIYIQFILQLVIFAWLKLFGGISDPIDFQALYILNPTPFLLMGRLVTAAFGAGTVLVTTLLARRIAGPAAGAVAGLVVAVSPLHIAKSQVVEVDVPLTFFCALYLWFGLQVMDRPKTRRFVGLGVALGLAISTKYTAALLVLPLLPVLWFAGRRPGHPRGSVREQGRGNKRGVSKKAHPQAPGPARGRWTLVTLASAFAAFALTSPFVLLDFESFRLALAMERAHMQAGHFGTGASRSWIYYLGALGRDGIGWPGLAAAVAASVWFGVRRRKPWALMLAVFVLGYWIAVGSWSMKAPRYVLPILPPLAVLAAVLLVEAASARRPMGILGRRAILGVGVLAVLTPALLGLPGAWQRTRPDTRTLARQWILANVPAGSMIVTESYGPELIGPLDLIPLPAELKQRVEAGAPVYGVLQIPMLQVRPELSARFYDLALYAASDYVVVSSTVRDRYLAEPRRFATQAKFYRGLDAGYERAAEFTPGTGPGPTVIVYRNPGNQVPLADREAIPGPPPLGATGAEYSGEENFFYYNLGLIFEQFAFVDAAAASYAAGLALPVLRPPIHVNLALALTRCALRTGRPQDAIRILDREAARCPNPADRRTLIRYRDRIAGR